MRRLAGSLPFALWAAVVAAAPAGGALGPWVDNGPVQVRLLSRWTAATPGGDAGLGVELRLAPGWHVYWKNAGDAGYAPEIDFAAGTLSDPRLLFPAPRRFELPGGLVAFGYADEVVYPIAATLPAAATAPLRHAARFDYLACAEQCVPYQAELALEQPLAAAAAIDPEAAGRLDPWRERLPRPIAELPGGRADGRLERATGPELDLVLTLSAPGLEPAAPQLFFAADKELVIERPAAEQTADGVRFTARVRPVDETRPLPERLRFAWTATGLVHAGVAAALEGSLELERPVAAVGGTARLLLAAVVVALLAVLIWRRLVAPSLARPV